MPSNLTKPSDRITVYKDAGGNKIVVARCETCEGHGCETCKGLGFVRVDENVVQGKVL